MIFRGQSASDAQKTIAPPKRMNYDSMPKHFENFEKKILTTKNKKSGIVLNAFSQSFSAVRAMFEGQTAVQNF